MLYVLPDTLVDDVAIRAIRCIVRKAIRRRWFRTDDFDDLVQDVVVQLLQKMDAFNPCKASWATFCTMIARNFLATESKKRKRQTQADSLHDQVEGVPLQDSIEDRHSTGRCFSHRRSDCEWIDLHEDLSDLVDRLPDPHREFCRCYLEQPSFSDVAKSLGVSRKTVYRRRRFVRECVSEEHLHEYQY